MSPQSWTAVARLAALWFVIIWLEGQTNGGHAKHHIQTALYFIVWRFWWKNPDISDPNLGVLHSCFCCFCSLSPVCFEPLLHCKLICGKEKKNCNRIGEQQQKTERELVDRLCWHWNGYCTFTGPFMVIVALLTVILRRTTLILVLEWFSRLLSLWLEGYSNQVA